MRNIFTLIGLALVAAAAAGWYLDWYHIHSTSTSTGQKVITVDFNADQAREDLKHAKDRVQQIISGTPTNQPGGNAPLPPLPPLPGANPSGDPNKNSNGFISLTPNKDGGVSLDIKPPQLPPLPFLPPPK
jgi:hypothetical protein